MYVLDQNVVSDIFKQRPKVLLRFHKHQEECCVTAIGLAEAYKGLYKPKRGTTPRQGMASFYDDIAKNMEVLPFDLVAARMYGECAAALPAGRTIDKMDMAIAAIVLSRSGPHTLVTNNLKDFAELAEPMGLRIEDWRA
jgi:predicted nucleic acid-binding protein